MSCALDGWGNCSGPGNVDWAPEAPSLLCIRIIESRPRRRAGGGGGGADDPDPKLPYEEALRFGDVPDREEKDKFSGAPVEETLGRRSPDEGGGILIRFPFWEEDGPFDFVDGPGLGGWEPPSLLSESTEEIVRRLALDLD